MDKKHPPVTSSESFKISFRPETEGLGFHPFSDGLPYAPMGKNPKSVGTSGTGAVAAGPPRAVTIQRPAAGEVSISPPARVPRISVPVAKKDATSTMVQAPKLILKKEGRGIAYIAARSLAYLFDVSLNSLLMGGLLIGLVWKNELQVDLLLSYGVPAGAAVFFLISSWALIAVQEVLFRTSLGKYLFHLKLDGSRFRTLVRALLFPFSLGFSGLGIFWSFFHARRSCWHDILSGIQPVESGKNG